MSVRELKTPSTLAAWCAPLLALSMSNMACSANLSPSAEIVDAEASSITAVVTVERGTKGDVVARFVRTRAGAVDEEALRMVGAAIELPPLGTCGKLQGSTPNQRGYQGPATQRGYQGPAKVSRSVELVNAGAVSLEADGYRGSLVARHLPDVVDLVSGVVYTSRAEGADAFPARGRFVLRAAGSSEADFEIAPFTVEATMPGEPGDLRIGGETSNATVSSTEPTEITWEPRTGDSEDVIYVDVTGRGMDKVRCLFADSGKAALSPSTFANLSGDEGTITVHRVHRETFRARGIDSGVMRFDFARVVGFHRR